MCSFTSNYSSRIRTIILLWYKMFAIKFHIYTKLSLRTCGCCGKVLSSIKSSFRSIMRIFFIRKGFHIRLNPLLFFQKGNILNEMNHDWLQIRVSSVLIALNGAMVIHSLLLVLLLWSCDLRFRSTYRLLILAKNRTRKKKDISHRISKGKGPNRFIIGAPKCATTSLYQLLTTHQDTCPSLTKEVHYFDRPKNWKKGWPILPTILSE